MHNTTTWNAKQKKTGVAAAACRRTGSAFTRPVVCTPPHVCTPNPANGSAPLPPQVFYHVTPDPTLACIEAGLKEILEFKPDVIIALGGGSPMDAAKVGAGGGVRVCVGVCVVEGLCSFQDPKPRG